MIFKVHTLYNRFIPFSFQRGLFLIATSRNIRVVCINFLFPSLMVTLVNLAGTSGYGNIKNMPPFCTAAGSVTLSTSLCIPSKNVLQTPRHILPDVVFFLWQHKTLHFATLYLF